MKSKHYLLFVLLLPGLCFAESNGLPALILKNSSGENTYSVSFQIIALMTMIGLLPGILMATTSFLRVIIVLMILRQAIGLTQTPSNQILLGLALFMTLFIMAPILNSINETAIVPYMENKISTEQAITEIGKPMRTFMTNHTRKNELAIFDNLAKEKISNEKDIPWTTLIPSFVTSELKTAFLIGFILFLPFLIIDLVVSSILMSMGMMMLSPMIISLPFKIMLFVMVDGWTLVLGSLASSFYI
jgi:flagellar biosynthetic protein FliP